MPDTKKLIIPVSIIVGCAFYYYINYGKISQITQFGMATITAGSILYIQALEQEKSDTSK